MLKARMCYFYSDVIHGVRERDNEKVSDVFCVTICSDPRSITPMDFYNSLSSFLQQPHPLPVSSFLPLDPVFFTFDNPLLFWKFSESTFEKETVFGFGQILKSCSRKFKAPISYQLNFEL
jgi:hypothetical protein